MDLAPAEIDDALDVGDPRAPDRIVRLRDLRSFGSLPTQKSWTVDEYMSLGEYGIVDGHTELIDGEILIMPPIGLPHVVCCRNFTVVLQQEWQPPKLLLSQDTFRFAEGWLPEPDLLLLEELGPDKNIASGNPSLVIEIMNSSTRRDLTVKRLRYAQNRVPEYWVADLPRRVLHVFRDPIVDVTEPEFAWRNESILKPEDIATPLCLPDLKIKVGDVIPEGGE
ncbi:MAG: Uma2 family endonuclease [Planctomycetota bacterium]